MATWQNLVDDTFDRPNSSTVGNNWSDQGGYFSISGQQLKAVVPSTSSRWLTNQLMRPASEATENQRVVLTTTSNTQVNNAYGLILGWQDASNFYYCEISLPAASTVSAVIYRVIAGVRSAGLKSVAFTFVPGNVYSFDFTRTLSAGTSTLQVSVTDVTAGTTSTSTTLSDSTAPLQASGRCGLVGTYINANTAQYSARFQSYYDSVTSMAVSPAVLSTLLGAQAVAVTGTGTSWTGTPFSLIGGGSITAQSVTDGTHATVTVNPGSTPISMVLSDGGTSLAYLPAATPTLILTPDEINTSSTGNSIALGGTAPVAWTPGTPGAPTFTASSGATITAQTVSSPTAATLTVSGGSSGAIVTVTDPDSAGSGTLNVLEKLSVNDAKFGFSPYVWKVTGSTSAECNWPGGYFDVAFTGTRCYLDVDVSALVAGGVAAANYPILQYQFDTSEWVRRQLASSDTRVTLSTALSSGSHTLRLFVNVLPSGVNRWGGSSPTSSLKVTGLWANGVYSTPASESKNLLLLGDSILEGVAVGEFTGTVTSDSFLLASSLAIGKGLGANTGSVVCRGQGWTTVGTGSVPAMPSAWPYYYNGTSRLFSGLLSPQPDYIVTLHGTNDAIVGASDAAVTAAVDSWLYAARAAAPSAYIVVVVPPGGFKQSAIQNGVASYQAAVPSDVRVKYWYLGPFIAEGLGALGQATFSSADGTHPRQWWNHHIASLVVRGVLLSTSATACSRSRVLGGV